MSHSLGFAARDSILIKLPADIPGVPVNDVSVHTDVSELIIHIRVVSTIRELSVGADPALPPPAVIVGPAPPVPVPISVEPGSNDEAGTEPDASIQTRVVIPKDIRIVFRHIDDLLLRRFDLNIVRLDEHLLLCIALKNSISNGQRTQALDRTSDIRPLHDIGLAYGGSPIRILRHHLQNRRIVRNCLDADVPRLRFDQALIHPALE